MASIVQRNESFRVIYTVRDGDKKKRKWETYHSYEEALRRKEQLEIVQQQKKEWLKYCSGTLAQFLGEYVELYGRIHWACSTYSSNIALIQNYIVPFIGTMQLHEFSPKVIAILYGKLQRGPKIAQQLMTQVHKLLHSLLRQMPWRKLVRQKAMKPKSSPCMVKSTV